MEDLRSIESLINLEALETLYEVPKNLQHLQIDLKFLESLEILKCLEMSRDYVESKKPAEVRQSIMSRRCKKSRI